MLCSNYESLLIEHNQVSEQLFGLLKDCARIPNLRLAVQSIDFWLDFKETINTCELKNEQHILEQYKLVAQILLEQSMKISSVPYEHNLFLEEIEELEIHEKGVSICRFREYTSEVLFSTFL